MAEARAPQPVPSSLTVCSRALYTVAAWRPYLSLTPVRKRVRAVPRATVILNSHWPRCAFAALALCWALLAGCGAPSLPSGVYTSQQYHFKITYPNGWQVNAQQQTGAAAPLIVIITHTGANSTANALISSLTVDVLNLNDAGGSKAAASLANDKTLTTVTLSGLTAYRDQPSTQQGAGANSAVTVTHTDYFLIHGDYEYQLSIDALSADSSALDTMANSFTII